jgi:translation initiation factor IF-2
MLAAASNAIIIGFNVRPDNMARTAIEREKVDVRLYRVIYNAVEDIQKAMKGMLEPEYKETELGRAEVRNTFKVTGVGMVAGCYVLEGKVTRNAKVRNVREGIVIHEGQITSLKRFKDDVREVASGYECGITLENFSDIKEGDIFEVFIMEEVEES